MVDGNLYDGGALGFDGAMTDDSYNVTEFSVQPDDYQPLNGESNPDRRDESAES